MVSRRSRILGYFRLLLMYLLVGWLAWMSRPTRATFLLGLPLVVVGESIRFWAAGHLLKSKELVTSGPYTYMQNPLYLGRVLIYTGFCLMAWLPPYGWNLLVLAAGLAVFFRYYIPRKVRVEGARLAAHHGAAWEAYHRAMPILFPRLTPYPGAVAAPWRSERMRRNKEWAMALGVGLVTLFFAWKAFPPA